MCGKVVWFFLIWAIYARLAKKMTDSSQLIFSLILFLPSLFQWILNSWWFLKILPQVLHTALCSIWCIFFKWFLRLSFDVNLFSQLSQENGNFTSRSTSVCGFLDLKGWWTSGTTLLALRRMISRRGCPKSPRTGPPGVFLDLSSALSRLKHLTSMEV